MRARYHPWTGPANTHPRFIPPSSFPRALQGGAGDSRAAAAGAATRVAGGGCGRSSSGCRLSIPPLREPLQAPCTFVGVSRSGLRVAQGRLQLCAPRKGQPMRRRSLAGDPLRTPHADHLVVNGSSNVKSE